MTTLTSAPVYDARTVGRLLGISYSNAELDRHGNVPDALSGYVTFFDPGLSIIELRVRVIPKIFYPQTWYDNEPFAQLEEQPRYRQLQMEVVKDSFVKTFDEHQASLPPDEEIPAVRVVATSIAIHFLTTGERLFPDYGVRCLSQTSLGFRVGVGRFASDGFVIGCCSDDFHNGDLGLASSRKF